MVKEKLSFGDWPSEISAKMVAGQSIRFGSLMTSEGWVYWSESRPDENGRSVIMRGAPDCQPRMLLPAPYSARSSVHEYGGGELLAIGDEIFFVNAKDQDIYRFAPGDQPERVTNAPGTRFADFCYDPLNERLIVVAERTSTKASAGGDHQYPENLLVCIELGGGALGKVEDFVIGSDFFASPRLSPDGQTLAWLAWDLPDMPWEAAALYVASIYEDGAIGPSQLVMGGDGSSVFQPEWLFAGDLYFVSDQSGWGNLYKWNGKTVAPLAPMEADCSRPLWVFGMRSHGKNEAGVTGLAAIEDGQSVLKIIATEGVVETLDFGLTSVENLVPFGDGFAAIVTRADMPAAIGCFKTDGSPVEIIRRSADVSLEPEDISEARVIDFFGENGETVFGQFYPPTNKPYTGLEGELPPVILGIHGGPSGMANRGFQWKIQYWTSRGFGFFDVDYSGSTGYGRAYRERLDGQWGVRDISDVIAAGRHLIDAGLADPKRLLVSGGSSGGYGVLMALVRSDIFAGGACYYGISDLNQLLKFTHKFEGGYTYRLTGTTLVEHAAVLTERSPLTHIADITSPLIVFQGLDDKVVPPGQSVMIVDGLRARGVEIAYHEFAGEGHGFRRAETIIAALEAELAFYKNLFSR